MEDEIKFPCGMKKESQHKMVKKRIYSKYCPSCGTTAKLDTEKYCSDRCKSDYKLMLERKFGS